MSIKDNKSKFFTIIIVFLIVTNLSLLHIYAGATDADLKNYDTIVCSSIKDKVVFSEPSIEKWGDYLFLKINETNKFLRDVGKPMVPMFRKTYTFPLGTKINSVECNPHSINSMSLSGKIKPASNIWYIPALNVTSDQRNSSREIIIENESIYSSSNPFPKTWFNYDICCGLQDNKNMVFLILSIYPIRYSPLDDEILYPDIVDINITYEEPSVNNVFSEQYDMVIIAPSTFRRALQSFIEYKNDCGVKTILKITEEIYNEYSGRDKPEQIKYFIKDAKETWNINYVLLVGGLKNYFYADDKEDCNQGSKAWHVPVRYINTEIGVGRPISDYYYADFYKYNNSLGYEFEDWDSNGNDIFAEGNYSVYKEKIDLCPDVHIGRLPCRNIFDIRIVVNKIKKYESNYNKENSWFKRMISISGNLSIPINGQPNGEVICDKAIEYMGDLVEPIKIYASNRESGGPVPIARDITREFSKGAGFVHIETHGTPTQLNVMWAENEDNNKNTGGGWGENWTGGIRVYQFWRLFNGRKLPIAVVNSCWNSLFNITFVTSLMSGRLGNINHHCTYGEPAFKCICWKLVSKPSGGAIATVGFTASESASKNSPYVPIGFSISSELDYDFFYQIGRKDVQTLGDAYSSAICKVIQENPIRSYESHCIMAWQIIGDPSLKIGGYNF